MHRCTNARMQPWDQHRFSGPQWFPDCKSQVSKTTTEKCKQEWCGTAERSRAQQRAKLRTVVMSSVWCMSRDTAAQDKNTSVPELNSRRSNNPRPRSRVLSQHIIMTQHITKTKQQHCTSWKWQQHQQ